MHHWSLSLVSDHVVYQHVKISIHVFLEDKNASPPKKNTGLGASYNFPIPPHTSLLSAMAIFLSPQGGHLMERLINCIPFTQ